ncbi:MAG: ribosome silencing factor [Proteobacteria bacterium]|nr:ribosome silencing factor [Pseudomonadota bacterium]
MAIVGALEDAKGHDLCVLDVSEISSFADYLVIATGTSDRHVRTLAERARETASRAASEHPRVEGLETCRWVLVDAFDVVVHVFVPEARDFYALERLWDEADPVDSPHAAGAT